MALEIFESSLEFGTVIFTFVAIIIIIRLLLFLRDFITEVATVLMRRTTPPKGKPGPGTKLANVVYMGIVFIALLYIFELINNPISVPSESVESSWNIWNFLMAALIPILILKTVVFFKLQIEEMGAIANRRQ